MPAPMSVISNRIKAIKDFAKASKAVEAIKGDLNIGEADKAAAVAALAERADHPDRVVSSMSNTTSVTSDGTSKEEARLARKAEKEKARNEILQKLAAQEITLQEASEQLAGLATSNTLPDGILDVDAIADYPTRALGQKGNTGWYFGGKTEIGGQRCQVSLNIVILKDKSK